MSFTEIAPLPSSSQRSIPEPSNIRGTFLLRVLDESGEQELIVPDPEELPRALPLTPSQLHVLTFVRENVMPGQDRFVEATETIGSEVGTGDDLLENEGEESPAQNNVTQDVCSSSVYFLCPGINAETVVKFLREISRIVDLEQTSSRRIYRFHERQRQVRLSPSKLRKKRLQRALRSGNLFKIGVWKCCSRYKCFERIGVDRCYEDYLAVNRMNPKQAKRYLIGLYDQTDNVFRLGGAVVCSRFLGKCLGFSNDVQCAVKSTPKARGSGIARSRPREVKRKTKRMFIALFIKHLSQLFGDAMPHKEHITLPVLNKKALWKECQDAWITSEKHDGDMQISQNYFYRVWRALASFVKVRKHTGFMLCSRCELLREETTKHLKDEDVLLVLIEQHATHLKFIEKERFAYEERQALAEQSPDRYCSIIIDGADQKNYGLPHFATNTKSDAGQKLKVKVVGVLEHIVRGQEWLSLFTMTEEYETGANHIVEVVHRALQRKKEKFGKLPPTLFVQVDNCIRENKNRYLMAYFQLFVHLGVFKMVQVSFLPIGHTHADIDQTFSSISTHLRINNAITVSELIRELEKCYARRVTASELENVINFSGLCERSGCLNEVESFTHYRYFRFLQKAAGSSSGLNGSSCDVKVQNEDEWVPFPNSLAQGFLKFVPCFAETPATVTRELSNGPQVMKCLDAAEERIKDDSKMVQLRALQEKVYQVRTEPYHWCTNTCFELNGDYLDAETSSDADNLMQTTARVEEALRSYYGYDPDDFVAVATNTDPNTQFWIGRVKFISELDADDRVKTLRIRWYVATGRNPYEAKYSPALQTVDGEQTVYEDNIAVESVLVRFSNLTNAKRIRARDKKAIKQTLNSN